MANQIGTEHFNALSGTSPTSPLISGTTKGGAKAAIYYVEKGDARYRGDGTAPTAVTSNTDGTGLPIPKGGHIVLVGRGNMARASFCEAVRGNGARVVGMYYDMVDIVAVDTVGSTEAVATDTDDKILDVLGCIQLEVKRLRKAYDKQTQWDSDDILD